ncbi:peptidase inhibitor family I36 protein [Lentzea sp. NPDC054927]
MRKPLCVLLAAAFALLSFLGTASADPSALVDPKVIVQVPMKQDVSAQALACDPGDLCVWRTGNGSAGRCSWTNRDNDWWNQPVVCSWSRTTPVLAVYNHGQSSNAGVCLYLAANYGGNVAYFFRQGEAQENYPNRIFRSHKWVPNFADCF